jgi:hypothetical protein
MILCATIIDFDLYKAEAELCTSQASSFFFFKFHR